MVKDMQDEAKELLKINVSLHKCKRAKRMIIQELDGSYKVQLEQLEAYAAAMKKAIQAQKLKLNCARIH